MKGKKGSVDEGGVRTPFIVSWPARFKGGRTQTVPIVSLDILPTAIEATGTSPVNQKFDGKSLLPLLTDNATQHHEHIYWSKGGEGDWAIRQGDWKIHVVKGNPELINLANDPSETRDLSGKHPMRVQQMTEDYRKWIQQMQNPITGGSRFWKQTANGAAPKPKTKSETRAAQRAQKRAQRKTRVGVQKDN